MGRGGFEVCVVVGALSPVGLVAADVAADVAAAVGWGAKRSRVLASTFFLKLFVTLQYKGG